MEPDEAATFDAINVLSAQAELAGLVRGAVMSGFLESCRTPRRLDDLADSVGMDLAVVRTVCAALRAGGILAPDDPQQAVVSPLWAPLLDRGLHRRAGDRLGAAEVRAGLFADLFTGRSRSYWDLDTAARVALAKDATGDPETEFGRELLLAAVHGEPEWEARFAGGGRYLELGCGVAGAIASFLHKFPNLTAVGVDVAADVLEVARSRARALGVADRATFVCSPAADFRDPEPFDVALWPQNFYPDETRAGALAALMANLRPGGLLVTFYIHPTSPEEATGPAEARSLAPRLDTVMRTLWGVRDDTAEQSRRELELAGFVEVTSGAAGLPTLPIVTARRPAASS